MTSLSKALGDALSTGSPIAAATIELGVIRSVTPLVVEHRGQRFAQGVGQLVGVTPILDQGCVLAVFGASARIVLGMV